ncbi:hypothetical protein [Nocardia salmonicida]|uniref:hypothetical protein n=1 Tax=Nocardia salmonicida TaxID=53431 RepID=UPI0007A55FD0|nr:hypothetical protein [Nocardia salmonicida]
MTAPAWVSQAFPPEGASAAEGIRNQLGKPELDHLTILVRESAQNSWDARQGDGIPVDYRIDLQTISAADAPAWRENLLRKAPAKQRLPLRDALQQATIRVLSISDRGTRGLGGPTRADAVTDQGRDFVAFLRNIGEPRERELGGGTYGFGKGILYLASGSGTILVHTRCQYQGKFETRLMAAALWKSYDAKEEDRERRYTGRHWWGDVSGDVIEPLVGPDADAMARKLGLRPFGATETGTTISILDPNLEGGEPSDVARYLAETIVYQLWPKMLPDGNGVPPMRFSVTCDGIEYPVPDPAQMKTLKLFVIAYQKMVGRDAEELHCRRPKKLLGRFGIQQTVALRFDPSQAEYMAGFETGMVHHVCLMRPAELVVTYWPGPKPASEISAYAGVFRADKEVDVAFARAEPPTHDNWNYQSLDHPEYSFVKMAFTRMKEEIDKVIGPRGSSGVEVAQVSLGAASDRLSPLVGGAWGIGSATDYGKPGDTAPPPRPAPKRRPSGMRNDPADSEDLETPDAFEAGGSGGDGSSGGDAYGGTGNGQPFETNAQQAPARRRRPKIEYVGDPEPAELWGHGVVVQRFKLPVSVLQRVSADVAVALASDGGLEMDPPTGAEIPNLVGWEDPAGEVHQTPTYVIEGGDGRVWKAVVKPAADTMTDIVLFTAAVV